MRSNASFHINPPFLAAGCKVDGADALDGAAAGAALRLREGLIDDSLREPSRGNVGREALDLRIAPLCGVHFREPRERLAAVEHEEQLDAGVDEVGDSGCTAAAAQPHPEACGVKIYGERVAEALHVGLIEGIRSLERGILLGVDVKQRRKLRRLRLEGGLERGTADGGVDGREGEA
jgi:hypothetical protein